MQRLRLVFATHEVTLRGYSLRRIETMIQRQELSLLAKLPRSQPSLIREAQPVESQLLKWRGERQKIKSLDN